MMEILLFAFVVVHFIFCALMLLIRRQEGSQSVKNMPQQFPNLTLEKLGPSLTCSNSCKRLVKQK